MSTMRSSLLSPVPLACHRIPCQTVFTRTPKTQKKMGRRLVCVAAATDVEMGITPEEGGPVLKDVWSVEESSRLYTASLNKPLGLTLADQGGKVVVETVADGGNGKAADVQVGDIVRGTTARSKNIQNEEVASVEAKNKQSFLGGLTLLKADNEDFDTVLAAIQSSKCGGCDVVLVLERPSA